MPLLFSAVLIAALELGLLEDGQFLRLTERTAGNVVLFDRLVREQGLPEPRLGCPCKLELDLPSLRFKYNCPVQVPSQALVDLNASVCRTVARLMPGLSSECPGWRELPILDAEAHLFTSKAVHIFVKDHLKQKSYSRIMVLKSVKPLLAYVLTS